MATLEQLEAALSRAASSHHDYETVHLNGVRDENWAGYYAAFVLGRLENLDISPSRLTEVLLGVSEADWSSAAALAIQNAVSPS